MPDPSPTPLLQLWKISKRFAGAAALTDVSLHLNPGEVLALIGQNGAGKSTLMNILGGIHQPDAGRIFINARQVVLRTVNDAVAQGIAFVHQELNNLDNLDIAANIFLGREPLWAGPLKLIDRRAIVQNARPHLRRLGLEIDPATPLGDLSLARQQLVEIARALSQNARILVFDEPTSSLTSTETARLLDLIKDLAAQQVSIIYITHRLGEISQIADRVVALRDGRNAGDLPREQINHDNMLRLMIGRDPRAFFATTHAASSTVRLQANNISTSAWPTRAATFDARAGEILGIGGLVGSGRSELAQAIFGAEPMLRGQILLDGQTLRLRDTRDAINAGIYLVPEDRRKTGLITQMTVRENITLPSLQNYTRACIIRRGQESAEAHRQIHNLQISAPNPESPVLNLSGGNQQKVVLAKWLALSPKVLIVDEPTRGIDVGAKAEIYHLLRELADQSVAIILISSDTEELLGISDRIAVLHEGAVAGIVDRPDFSPQNIMTLAFGKTPLAPQ